MTRRKGEVTDKQRDRSHPHQVEIVVPPSGMHGGAGIMARWAAWHDHETTHSGCWMAWCFCRREVADAFVQDFGGRRSDRPLHPASLAVDIPDANELRRRARAACIGMEIVSGGREFGLSAPFQGAEVIPFASFGDPATIARYQAVLDGAWTIVEPDVPEPERDLQRMRLAYIIVAYSSVAGSGDELVSRSAERFRDPRRGRDFASEFRNGQDARSRGAWH